MDPNELIPVGRITGVFGIRGELKCDPTSAGRVVFCGGARLHARFRDGATEEIVLGGIREHKGRLLLTLPGIESADAAQRYAGVTLFAARERIILEPGEYLDRDLSGCRLFAPDGTALGTVDAVEHYPASDMLVVGGQLVPMVGAFIKRIDVAKRRIDVDLPPGLLD